MRWRVFCCRSSKVVGHTTLVSHLVPRRAAELGNVQTGIGAYIALAWAMGLDSSFTGLLKPEDDPEGAALELASLPQRVRHAKADADDDF